MSFLTEASGGNCTRIQVTVATVIVSSCDYESTRKHPQQTRGKRIDLLDKNMGRVLGHVLLHLLNRFLAFDPLQSDSSSSSKS
jgi:hypothetical protein